MRKIFILSCLLLSHTALCEYLMSDGNGYIGEDGTYYTGDGTGGFFTSDGQLLNIIKEDLRSQEKDQS